MKVHSKVARKDYPADGIAKGDRYFSWTPYRAKTRRSLTMPSPQQLTDREELIALYDAQDMADDVDFSKPHDELASAIQDVIDKLQEAADVAQEKYDNLPENFQSAERGEALEQFIGECDEAISELDNHREDHDPENESDDPPTDLDQITWPSEF